MVTLSLLEWTATVIDLLSLSFSLYMVLLSLLQWRKDTKSGGTCKPMVKQITAIAVIDSCGSLWAYVSALRSEFLMKGDPQWCTTFATVRWFFFILSALVAASISLGVLSALHRWTSCVSMIRFAVPLATVLAAVATLPAVFGTCTLGYDCYPVASCVAEKVCIFDSTTQYVFSAELLAIFLFTVVAHLWTLQTSRKFIPNSVVRRSVRIAFRYHCAFWASFGLYVIVTFLPDEPVPARPGLMDIFVTLAWRLLMLNGFFNFVAFRLHLRDAAAHPRSRLDQSVAFQEHSEVRFFDDVDYRRWTAACDVQIGRIHGHNMMLLEKLGIIDAVLAEEDDMEQQLLEQEARRPIITTEFRMRGESERVMGRMGKFQFARRKAESNSPGCASNSDAGKSSFGATLLRTKSWSSGLDGRGSWKSSPNIPRTMSW